MTDNVQIDIIARDKTKQGINQARKGFDGLKSSIFNVRNALIGLGAGVAIRGLINTGKEVENLAVRFKFLFGSAKEGAKAFEQLTDFAAKVPFSLEEISAGSGSLAVVADNAEDLNRVLQITGNVAAVAGLDFAKTAEQIQRAFSSGIGSADLFREKGIGALLGFKAGAQVTVAETVEAFEKAFGPGGKFDGATDDLADTFTGTLSMIGDKFFKFQNDVNEGFFNELKFQFKELDRFFAENEEEISKFAKNVGEGLATAVRQAADAVKFLHQNADILKAAFAAIIAFKFAKVMYGVAASITATAVATQGLNKAMKGNLIFGAIAAVVGGVVMLKDAFSDTADEIDNLANVSENASMGYEDAIMRIAAVTEREKIKIQEDMKAIQEAIARPKSFDKIADRFKSEEKLLEEKLEKELKMLTEHEQKLLSKQQTLAEEGKTLLQSELNQLAEINILKEELEFEHLAKIDEMNFESAQKRIAEEQRVADEKAAIIAKNTQLFKDGKFAEMDMEKVTSKQTIQLGRHTLQEGAKINKELFRLNQALNIGEAIMNTAKGVTAALPNIPLAIAIGAMGAIQVATIAAQQPPAQFGGIRQAGTPVLVGEKGPELFTPASAGTVTPNHNLGSGPVTVNFNINTVSAKGFNELLQGSRGMITNIINQAVNEKGRTAIV